ncbi:MAG: cytochrome C, partial [Pseudomonadota bacterium]
MARFRGSGAMAAGALILTMMLPAAAEDDKGYARLEGHGGPVKGLAVSPDGRLALSASFDTSLGLWSLPAGEHLRWLEGHEAGANAVRFLGDGRALSVGDDFDLLLWDLEQGSLLRRLEGHRGKVIGLAVSPDRQQVATAGWDGAIGLWTL